jgi:hypothetical protein
MALMVKTLTTIPEKLSQYLPLEYIEGGDFREALNVSETALLRS